MEVVSIPNCCCSLQPFEDPASSLHYGTLFGTSGWGKNWWAGVLKVIWGLVVQLPNWTVLLSLINVMITQDNGGVPDHISVKPLIRVCYCWGGQGVNLVCLASVLVDKMFQCICPLASSPHAISSPRARYYIAHLARIFLILPLLSWRLSLDVKCMLFLVLQRLSLDLCVEMGYKSVERLVEAMATCQVL